MSEQVQVRITGMVMTNRYGTLDSGDMLRTDAAFAKHLVEECDAAEYIKVDAPAAAPMVEKSAAKPASKKAKQERPAENPESKVVEESAQKTTE